jgi:DNA-binding transcriptional MerR regulator
MAVMMTCYTVKQLSDLAGVSRRTLHYYDQIGLLKPQAIAANGYRRYGRADLLRLQQILFYRELGLSLEQIGRILDDPGFDALAALEQHRLALLTGVQRLERLVGTVDQTILMLKGDLPMDEQRLFDVFSEEQQKEYEEEATRLWGEQVRISTQKWNSYTPEQKAAIGAEGEANYREMLAHMAEGPESPAVQAAVAKWHQHMRYFYEPSVDRLEGLGHMYNQDPRFQATFLKVHPDFPAFLEQAITYYCKRLRGK